MRSQFHIMTLQHHHHIANDLGQIILSKLFAVCFLLFAVSLANYKKIAWLLVHVLCRIYGDGDTFGWMVNSEFPQMFFLAR